jgi:sec-independent protein translocase protein TatB
MFSFGWGEILLILLVVIIVVGPKDIPKFLRQIGNLSKSIKKVSREFMSSLNQITEETDLKDVKNSITEVTNLNKELDIKSSLKNEIKTIKETISYVEKDFSNINKSKEK